MENIPNERFKTLEFQKLTERKFQISPYFQISNAPIADSIKDLLRRLRSDILNPNVMKVKELR